MSDHDATDPETNTAGACADWDIPVSLLASGCLDSTAAAAVESHLVGCPRCAERHEELARLGRLLESAAPAPRYHAAAIRGRAAVAATRRPGPWRSVVSVPRRALPWVVTAAAAATVWVVTDRFSGPPPKLPGVPQRVTAPVDGRPVAAPAPVALPPLLLARELAAASSDTAFDAVLARQPGSASFASSEPPFLRSRFSKELVP